MFDLMENERKAEDPEEDFHSTIYRKSCLLVVLHSALMMRASVPPPQLNQAISEN